MLEPKTIDKVSFQEVFCQICNQTSEIQQEVQQMLMDYLEGRFIDEGECDSRSVIKEESEDSAEDPSIQH